MKLAPSLHRQALGSPTPARLLGCLIQPGSSAQPQGQSGGILSTGCAAAPRGPWLRCKVYCLGPSRCTPSPSVRFAGTGRFHRIAARPPGRRCAGVPRQPTRRSLLSRPCCPCVPRTLPREVRRPVLLTWGARYQASSRSDPSRHPHARLCQQSPAGAAHGAASFALGCGPQVCLAPLVGADTGSLWAPVAF